jgi:pilus assembly protein Flp/PilA
MSHLTHGCHSSRASKNGSARTLRTNSMRNRATITWKGYTMLARIRTTLSRQDEGASAVEYGLLIAAIAALIVAIVFGLGGLIKGVFTKTSSCVQTNGSNAGC